ncbi:MAG: hypothetical protein MUE41_03020 [Gemmatimonadaceae bacterium]|jgi:hypothetical protein|nr:hypothetical protein [Gemmatimonadaceae bacterium]
MPFESAGAFAGAAGVGALCVLGVFLLLDGRAPGVFPTVEFYARTATWGIVAAVPVLAITYVVGLLAITGTVGLLELALGPSIGSGALDAAAFAAVDTDSPIGQVYLQLRQEQGILGGSAVGMLVIATGAFAERRNLPDVRAAVSLAATLAVIASALCVAGAVVKGKEAHALATLVQQANLPTGRP